MEVGSNMWGAWVWSDVGVMCPGEDEDVEPLLEVTGILKLCEIMKLRMVETVSDTCVCPRGAGFNH